MNQHESDWKDFVSDERMAATVAALRAVPYEEPPRRIAFVSDKVFEPTWWQRVWTAPRWGFASAAMLSGAIVFHAASRPAPVLVQSTPPPFVQASVPTADVDALIRKAVAETEKKGEARTVALVKAAEERMMLEHGQVVLAMRERDEYLTKKFQTFMRASVDRGDGQ